MYADQYQRLFDLRSAFLHGRKMAAISTQDQIIARSLARQVVDALVVSSQIANISSRENFLENLVDKGAPLIVHKHKLKVKNEKAHASKKEMTKIALLNENLKFPR